MTPDEITALLALWADYPETAPLDVVYVCGTFQTTDTTFSNVHAAALARDRLMELLVDSHHGVTISGGSRFCVSCRIGTDSVESGGTTKLKALIVAYRAMKGPQ